MLGLLGIATAGNASSHSLPAVGGGGSLTAWPPLRAAQHSTVPTAPGADVERYREPLFTTGRPGATVQGTPGAPALVGLVLRPACRELTGGSIRVLGWCPA